MQLVTEDADPQKELLYEVVSGLPEEQQELFHMRYFWEMTQQEIADRLGISQNVVSRRIRKLEDLLARKCRDAL